MKKILFFALGAAMLSVASCDHKADIVGEWQGTVKDEMPGAATSNIIVNYDFRSDGSLMAAYEFDIAEAMQPNGEIVSPYQVNVSATATVQGNWKYVEREDDEVAITYDMSTIDVKIDPESVVMRENVFSSEQEPQVDSLKTAMQQRYEMMITSYLKQNQSELWDDVKVKKPVLKYEIGHYDYVLHQVMAE